MLSPPSVRVLRFGASGLRVRSGLVAIAVAALALAAGAGETAGRSGRPRLYFRPTGCQAARASVAFRGGAPRRVVALTFDDGPAPDTEAFVHMLARSGAVGTFFMIGDEITAGYGPLLRQELRFGDALGDHTFTHPDLLATPDVAGQLSRTVDVIRRLTRYTPCVFRPPYGYYDARVVATARRLGLSTVLWDVDPSDYTQPGVGAIVNRVLAAVRPGSIILSHDGGGQRAQTLAAYPIVIAALRRRGFGFDTVPELLRLRDTYVRCTRACGDTAVGHVPPRSIVTR